MGWKIVVLEKQCLGQIHDILILKPTPITVARIILVVGSSIIGSRINILLVSGNTKVKLEFYPRPIFQTWWPLTSRLLSSPYVYTKRMSQFCHILSSEWLKNFLCVEIINFHLQFTLTHFPKSFNLDHLFYFIMFSFTIFFFDLSCIGSTY